MGMGDEIFQYFFSGERKGYERKHSRDEEKPTCYLSMMQSERTGDFS